MFTNQVSKEEEKFIGLAVRKIKNAYLKPSQMASMFYNGRVNTIMKKDPFNWLIMTENIQWMTITLGNIGKEKMECKNRSKEPFMVTKYTELNKNCLLKCIFKLINQVHFSWPKSCARNLNLLTASRFTVYTLIRIVNFKLTKLNEMKFRPYFVAHQVC